MKLNNNRNRDKVSAPLTPGGHCRRLLVPGTLVKIKRLLDLIIRLKLLRPPSNLKVEQRESEPKLFSKFKGFDLTLQSNKNQSTSK